MRAWFLILVVLSGSASADIHRNTTAGVSIDLPRHWQRKTGGDSSVFASDPSGDVAVMFASSPGTTATAVSADVDTMLSGMATAVRWGPQKPIVVGGIKAVSIAGTAKTGGVAVTTNVVILITPKKRAVFVLGLVASNREAAHRATLDRIARSLQLD